MFEAQKISNLVFEGGGVGAIAYAGFLIKAEKTHGLPIKNIKRVAGVSSGAIAGLQVALNYSTAEIADEMKNTDFRKFADGANGWLMNIFRLLTTEGFYKQEYLYKYICKLIKAKTGNANLTFLDLQDMKEEHHFKDLYIVATKLFTVENQPAAVPFIFSHEHTPHTRVADAIRASAALPIIFPPMRLSRQENGKYIPRSDGDIYVDGGILESYPIRIFDSLRYLDSGAYGHKENRESIVYNPETLGLRLESPLDIKILQKQKIFPKAHVISSRLQYAEALLYVLRRGQQEISFADSPDNKRTIIIDTFGITSTDFNLTDAQKQQLFASGEQSTDQLTRISA
jgi:NTE family protein